MNKKTNIVWIIAAALVAYILFKPRQANAVPGYSGGSGGNTDGSYGGTSRPGAVAGGGNGGSPHSPSGSSSQFSSGANIDLTKAIGKIGSIVSGWFTGGSNTLTGDPALDYRPGQLFTPSQLFADTHVEVAPSFGAGSSSGLSYSNFGVASDYGSNSSLFFNTDPGLFSPSSSLFDTPSNFGGGVFDAPVFSSGLDYNSFGSSSSFGSDLGGYDYSSYGGDYGGDL